MRRFFQHVAGMSAAHENASTGVENISSSSSNEIVLENANPIVTVEEDSAGPESVVVSGKDDIEKDLCKTNNMRSTWIPTAEEEDLGTSNSVAYTQPPLQLLPPSIDSLVAAKAAIAAQSRPTEAAILSEHGAEERRHSSLAKRQARREYVLAASSNVETSAPLNNAANDDDAALPEEGLLLPTISAEIVSESVVATERERFIQEVRDRVTAEVVQADLVQVSQHPDNNEIAQLDSPKRPWWYLPGIASCILLLLIGIMVGVIVSTRANSSNLPIVQSTTIATTSPTRSNAPTMAPSLILPNGKHAFTATAQLYDAVDSYEAALQDFGSAENSDVAEMYGYPIGTWDVSRLFDFSRVFTSDRTEKLDVNARVYGFISPNEDLSGWDVSNATTMSGMFAGAGLFIGKGLEHWKVGRVTDFSYTFLNAHSFVGNVSLWDTSSAITMEAMLANAQVFNGDVAQWDVSSVRNMAYMFYSAQEFEGGDLTRWNVSQVETTLSMFSVAAKFNGNVATWNLRSLQTMSRMVRLEMDFLRQTVRLATSFCLLLVFWRGTVQRGCLPMVSRESSRHESTVSGSVVLYRERKFIPMEH
jgi:Mycoplasma protein of unknown function, DUF285